MDDIKVFSAMQSDEPLKRYVKTILGQVHLFVLDPFSNKPVETILSGPNGSENSYVEVWTPQEDKFLQKANRSHFRDGRIKEMEHSINEVPSPNQLSDTEIDEILDARFMVLKNKLDKFTSTAPVYRLLERAEEKGLGEKILNHLREKITELSL